MYAEPQEGELDLVDQQQPITGCSEGHRVSLCLQTEEGGSICLLCLSNLISNPCAPTFHVSYALSHLSHALSQHHFLHSLLPYHLYLLIPSLVRALSSFDDDRIAHQLLDIITGLCVAADASVAAEFLARLADTLSSAALVWSGRQLYTLHCFGVLLNCQNDPYAHIKDKDAIVSNLVAGLQSPSEDIRGEVLFVLYKLSDSKSASNDSHEADILRTFCPNLLYLSLEALMKTPRNDVRLNCVALLTIFARKGLFGNTYGNDISGMSSDEADNIMQTTQDGFDETPLIDLFCEAIKGPLLSSDSQVQISTLDLIYHYLSWEDDLDKKVGVLMEKNIVDYVFEILRLSGMLKETLHEQLDLPKYCHLSKQCKTQITTLVFAVSYTKTKDAH